jgi:hypothetical protein
MKEEEKRRGTERIGVEEEQHNNITGRMESGQGRKKRRRGQEKKGEERMG